MNKPAGYKEAQVLGEYTPINLGGHKLVIMQVEDKIILGVCEEQLVLV